MKIIVNIVKAVWYILMTVVAVISGFMSLINLAAICDENFRKEIIGSKTPEKKYGVDCCGIEIEDPEENEFSDMEQFMFKKKSEK